jgi:hypothetical protein
MESKTELRVLQNTKPREIEMILGAQVIYSKDAEADIAFREVGLEEVSAVFAA